jgi:hypothetical protein
MAVEDADALFEVAPADFVRARDQLATRLRDEGRDEEAADVKRLRRPAVAVWALNQAARRHPDEVAGLLDAAGDVGEAQRRGDGAALRRADDEVTSRVSRLGALAARLVVDQGVAASGRQPEREAALRAAALAGDPAGELREGRLRELPELPTGIEMWSAGVTPADGVAEMADPQEHRADEARARLRKAEAEAARLRARVERGRDRIDELEQQLAREREAVAEAREQLKAAHDDVRSAEREVRRLGGGDPEGAS